MFNSRRWSRNLFTRESEPVFSEQEAKVNALKARADRAAESLLENEALTADLDDDAAKVLLDWGIACVNMMAQSTRGLDDLAAAMAPRLRALRRLMRLVNRWLPKRSEMANAGQITLLTKIIERAMIVYDKEFTLPDTAQWDTFLQHNLATSPVQTIENLQVLIENLVSNSKIDLEKTND